MEKEKKIKVEIIKEPDLLLKDGNKVRIKDGTYKKSDVLGIILGSGKIVSLNIYKVSKFSESNLKNYPKERMIWDSVEKARRDNNGLENTDYLNLFCNDSKINTINCFLNFDEYLPSVGEMLEVIKEKERINTIRISLGLKPLEDGVWYWTSTIRDKEIVWYVRSYGDVFCSYWYSDWYNCRVISFVDSY